MRLSTMKIVAGNFPKTAVSLVKRFFDVARREAREEAGVEKLMLTIFFYDDSRKFEL